MDAEKVRCFMASAPFLKRSRILRFLCFGLYCFKWAKSTGRTDKIHTLFFLLFVDCHKAVRPAAESQKFRWGGNLPPHRSTV